MKRILLLLTFVLALQQLPAQVSEDNLGSPLKGGDALYEPLWVHANGGGRIIYFKDGQMLEVGHRYMMIAIPEPGYVFKNWELVNVFTEITYFTNQFGAHVSTNIVASPTEEFVKEPLLEFTMPQAEVITDSPLLKITASTGWQANFAPRGK
jgi:Divergent InlB B-repeat domain